MEKTKNDDIIFARDQLCMTELINQKVVGLSIGLIVEHQSQNKVLVLLLKDVNKGPVLHLKGVYVFVKRSIIWYRTPWLLNFVLHMKVLVYATTCYCNFVI
ncbi:hypothetical protein IFM89_029660 [Coptis chinensis]|uniref:Uncharacterized protein n=1 Tax=Coptis chinensis TaxID=261450 RepID=A0A835MA89_9MAGN|nr:hypothetical protein IFM89_029660 [Coptis chinensis]